MQNSGLNTIVRIGINVNHGAAVKSELSHEFIATLVEHEFCFFASVPCSILAPYLLAIRSFKQKVTHVSALREDVGVGIAAGAALSGHKSVVLMQNSGLGVSVNALTSLVLPFKIPMLLVVSYRGYKGRDSEENFIMGNITVDLLKKLQVPTVVLNTKYQKDIIKWASDIIDKSGCVTILIPLND